MAGADQPIGPVERDRLLHIARPPVAVAVSGGADSMALLHLAAAWVRDLPVNAKNLPVGVAPLVALTVDHGLRAESTEEARWVGAEAERLGVPHIVMQWTGAKPQSGLQEAARDARYGLMTEWAGCEELTTPRQILLAHHLDDQAETVLMRLARGSGIDGLSGMRETIERIWLRLGHPLEERRVTYLRPFLAIPGARLRATLSALGARHIEDPSNQDTRHERVRVRRALVRQDGDGSLTACSLGASARRLGMAREALEATQQALAQAAVDMHDGAWASIDAHMLVSAPKDTALRLLQQVISALGGQREAPRERRKLEALLEALSDPGSDGRTLAGAMVSRIHRKTEPGQKPRAVVAVHREPGRKSLPEITLRPGQGVFWDNRFYVSLAPDHDVDLMLQPLGLASFAMLKRKIPAVAKLPLPAKAAATLPSLWRGTELIAVPYLSRVAAELDGPQDGARSMISMTFADRHLRAIYGPRQVDTEPSTG